MCRLYASAAYILYMYAACTADRWTLPVIDSAVTSVGWYKQFGVSIVCFAVLKHHLTEMQPFGY